jgi:hypothetical protein
MSDEQRARIEPYLPMDLLVWSESNDRRAASGTVTC